MKNYNRREVEYRTLGRDSGKHSGSSNGSALRFRALNCSTTSACSLRNGQRAPLSSEQRVEKGVSDTP